MRNNGRSVNEIYKVFSYMDNFLQRCTRINMGNCCGDADSCSVHGDVLYYLNGDNFPAVQRVWVILNNNPIGDNAMLYLNNISASISQLNMSIDRLRQLTAALLTRDWLTSMAIFLLPFGFLNSVQTWVS